ncbi:MAG TPA: hypothetical protein PLN48_06465 [Lachnospiraceae bacterium]|nr:hypothetical protein [Lachnospiraceae bacterium]
MDQALMHITLDIDNPAYRYACGFSCAGDFQHTPAQKHVFIFRYYLARCRLYHKAFLSFSANMPQPDAQILPKPVRNYKAMTLRISSLLRDCPDPKTIFFSITFSRIRLYIFLNSGFTKKMKVFLTP